MTYTRVQHHEAGSQQLLTGSWQGCSEAPPSLFVAFYLELQILLHKKARNGSQLKMKGEGGLLSSIEPRSQAGNNLGTP